MNSYYVQIAKDADGWVRGLTMTDGGANLLRMAGEFEHLAQSKRTGQKNRAAYTVLAAALRRHVQAVREFYQEQNETIQPV